MVIDIDGSETLRTETLIAYETGYRFQRNLSVDVATYYNQYDRLINTQQTISFIPGALLTSYLYVNQGGAQTHGAEISAQWHPIRRWTLAGGVTETRGSPNALRATPEHLFNLQSQLNVTKKIDFHTSLYHYSEVPPGRIASYVVVPFQSVPEFDRLDVGGDWHLRPEWTLGVWGQNLQSPRHVETRNTLFRDGSGLTRSFKLMWQSKPKTRPSRLCPIQTKSQSSISRQRPPPCYWILRCAHGCTRLATTSSAETATSIRSKPRTCTTSRKPQWPRERYTI